MKLSENINIPEVFFLNDRLTGEKVEHISRQLKDLKAIFKNGNAIETQNEGQVVYEVDSYFPVKEGTEGGLLFGITKIFPGKVENEYFMTKGHFHINPKAPELYWGIEGEGLLLFMDRNKKTWAEKMSKGSMHYIPCETAHRTINTGSVTLSFAACWPADAGHNYEIVEKQGFPVKVIDINGVPTLIER